MENPPSKTGTPQYVVKIIAFRDLEEYLNTSSEAGFYFESLTLCPSELFLDVLKVIVITAKPSKYQ